MCQKPVTVTIGGVDEGWTGVLQAAWQREHGEQRQGAAYSRNDDTLGRLKHKGACAEMIWGGRQGQILGSLKCQAKEDRLYLVR